ncbi:uncharacterized protein G2W53_005109 [Senna tora]|uniref:Uncharacterized protein n=1 Tax=Senna tora TaxID=362788 RepID=A0A834XF30_9FABA|nr:uncharacterized protein G2W53_005109 [Senna tora]
MRVCMIFKSSGCGRYKHRLCRSSNSNISGRMACTFSCHLSSSGFTSMLKLFKETKGQALEIGQLLDLFWHMYDLSSIKIKLLQFLHSSNLRWHFGDKGSPDSFKNTGFKVFNECKIAYVSSGNWMYLP